MRIKAFFAAITFCFTSVFLPAIILEASGGIKMTTGITTSLILIVYIGLHLSYLVFDGGKKILDITFWIFSYVWLGAASLAQHATEQYPWWGYYNESDILPSFFVIIIGFVSYDLATYFVIRSYGYAPKINRNLLRFSYTKTVLLGIVASCISIYVISLIGLENFFIARKELSATFETKMESILQQNFGKAPIFACLLICITFIKYNILNRAKHISIIVLIILLLILNLIVSNPISSPRYWIGTIILCVFFLIVNWKSYTNFLLINLFILSFIVLFPYTDAFRRTTDPTINMQLQEEAILNTLTKKGDYDAYQMLMNTLKYTQSTDITYGRQLMGAILFWVPRKMWSNKPNSSGQYVAEGLRYKYTNLSCPLWAEAYINFGLIGVIVIFYIYGIVKEKLQIIYSNLHDINKEVKTNNYLTVLVPFLAAYQIFALRGTLINAFAYSSVFFLFFFLHLKHSKDLKKEDQKKEIALKSIGVS